MKEDVEEQVLHDMFRDNHKSLQQLQIDYPYFLSLQRGITVCTLSSYKQEHVLFALDITYYEMCINDPSLANSSKKEGMTKCTITRCRLKDLSNKHCQCCNCVADQAPAFQHEKLMKKRWGEKKSTRNSASDKDLDNCNSY